MSITTHTTISSKGISSTATKLSLFARFVALLSDFGSKGQVPGPVKLSGSATGKPNGTELPPGGEDAAENYYAYLPLFVP